MKKRDDLLRPKARPGDRWLTINEAALVIGKHGNAVRDWVERYHLETCLVSYGKKGRSMVFVSLKNLKQIQTQLPAVHDPFRRMKFLMAARKRRGEPAIQRQPEPPAPVASLPTCETSAPVPCVKSPIFLLNHLVTRRGEEWVLRLAENITIFSRLLEAVAQDLGVSPIVIEDLRRSLFERKSVEGKVYWILKGAVREQLNRWERLREKRFRDLLLAEREIQASSSGPQKRQVSTEKNLSSTNPGLANAMVSLEQKMGSVTFRHFLSALRSDMPHTEVAARFREFEIQHSQIALWRKVLTQKTRQFIPRIAREIARSRRGSPALSIISGGQKLLAKKSEGHLTP